MRKRILVEAIRQFGTNGVDRTSMQSIADEVGIRKQSLFHHFASKEALRKAVNRDFLDHWQRELPRLLAEASGGHDRFSSTVEALVGFFQQDVNRARVAIREMLDRPEEVGNLVAEVLSPWTRILVNYLRTGQEAGTVKPDVDPDAYLSLVTMTVICTVALGPVASSLTDAGRGGTMEANVRELIRIARDTLFVRPAGTGRKNKEA